VAIDDTFFENDPGQRASRSLRAGDLGRPALRAAKEGERDTTYDRFLRLASVVDMEAFLYKSKENGKMTISAKDTKNPCELFTPWSTSPVSGEKVRFGVRKDARHMNATRHMAAPSDIGSVVGIFIEYLSLPTPGPVLLYEQDIRAIPGIRNPAIQLLGDMERELAPVHDPITFSSWIVR
jgi:hypothetical protein